MNPGSQSHVPGLQVAPVSPLCWQAAGDEHAAAGTGSGLAAAFSCFVVFVFVVAAVGRSA